MLYVSIAILLSAIIAAVFSISLSRQTKEESKKNRKELANHVATVARVIKEKEGVEEELERYKEMFRELGKQSLAEGSKYETLKLAYEELKKDNINLLDNIRELEGKLYNKEMVNNLFNNDNNPSPAQKIDEQDLTAWEEIYQIVHPQRLDRIMLEQHYIDSGGIVLGNKIENP